jgi:rhodanese-related sulfurtransferase
VLWAAQAALRPEAFSFSPSHDDNVSVSYIHTLRLEKIPAKDNGKSGGKDASGGCGISECPIIQALMSDSNLAKNPDTPAELVPFEIDVQTAADSLKGNSAPLLLDVREQSERDYCNLGEGLHIPTGEIPFKWKSIPRDRTVLVYCHHGMRSHHVTLFLRERGYDRVQNMAGGIEAWSREIDPMVPRY